MMFQVPALLGLLWLLIPAFAEAEISSKETHQVYSYTYHFQHNGSTDPKQFLQSFLPDPPEGGSAVRTFFNPNLRGFISKGYLPAGPANTFRTTFPRTPNLPTFEGIKNIVDQNIRNGFQQQSPHQPPPEFAALPEAIEKNIADIRNDISNSFLRDNEEHQNHVDEGIRSIFQDSPRPVVHSPVLQHRPPPVPPILPAPVPPPPPPPPPTPPQVPNDGVIRNVRTFEKDLPNGKVFEKVETLSYNPAPVSNFVNDVQKFDGGERRNQHFNNQNEDGFGFRSTSYFRKEFRTGNNERGDPNDAGKDILPWKTPSPPQISNNNNINENNINPVQPLKLLIIPAFNNIDKFTGGIRENVNAVEIRPQNVANKPNSASNSRGQGGFGLRLRKPVIATLRNQQQATPAAPPPTNPQNVHNLHSNHNNLQSRDPVVGVSPVQFNQQQRNLQPPPINHPPIQANIHQQSNQYQQRPNHHQQRPNNQQHQRPNNHIQQLNVNHQPQQPNLHHQQPNLHNQQPNLHQQPPKRPTNTRAHQNFNNNINTPNVFRNDFNVRHSSVQNDGHREGINNFNHNNNADQIIQNVNSKLRNIDEKFNSISRSKPDSGFFWDDGDREWDPFPKMEWGNRLTTSQGPHRSSNHPVDRPFSNGHSGPNRVQGYRADEGDTHTMDILRHTLEALVGRKLDIPVLPAVDRNGGGGIEKVFASDRVVEGPNSYSRDQRSGIERNFQVNSNVGYQRSNQWSTDTARKLDTQSSRDDFRRDFIDVFAEDI